jgi:hypothetical protein
LGHYSMEASEKTNNNKIENENRLTELKDFYDDLGQYAVVVRRGLDGNLSNEDKQQRTKLLISLNHRAGYLGKYINELAGIQMPVNELKNDIWISALKIPPDEKSFSMIRDCIQFTIRAMGQFEFDVNNGIRNKKTGELIQKDTKTSDTVSRDLNYSPEELFNAMQFHPKIIKVSKALFSSGHYSEAIFAAYKAVNNFVKKEQNFKRMAET